MMGVARVLLRPTAHTLPWTALAAGGALGLLLVAVPWMFSMEIGQDVGVGLLRITALAGVMGIAMTFDDPARHTTGVLPAPRPLRQAVRVTLVLPPAAAWWAAVLAMTSTWSDGLALPIGAVTLEAAALFALTIAVAATLIRFTSMTHPGPAVAGILLATFIAAAALADHVPLVVPPGDERWTTAHNLWAALALAASLTWAAGSPEPRRRLAAVR